MWDMSHTHEKVSILWEESQSKKVKNSSSDSEMVR